MRRFLLAFATLAVALAAGTATPAAEPIKALIITGDNVAAHDWKGTTQMLQDFLGASGRIKVDVTSTPAKDLTDDNLAKYDVLILNYRETKDGAADTQWSDANKAAFLKAVEGGQGPGGPPLRLGGLRQPELEGLRAGDRRRLADAGLPRPEARVQGQEDTRPAPGLRGAARPSSTT